MMKVILDFVVGFFCIYWDNHLTFVFKSILWFVPLIDLHMLNHLSIWEKANLVMVYTLHVWKYNVLSFEINSIIQASDKI